MASDPFLVDRDFRLCCGDALAVLRSMPAESVDAVVTSPPYLDVRSDTGIDFDKLVSVLRELPRVCAGPVLLNVGGFWRRGVESLWWADLVREVEQDLPLLDTRIWCKPNGNPLHGRFFADSHEYVLVLGDPDRASLNIDECRTP